jgi:hypothetical protein
MSLRQPQRTQPNTSTAQSEALFGAAKAGGYNPNSPEYQAWLMERNATGKAIMGDNRSTDPNKVLVGLQRAPQLGGGVWGQPVRAGQGSTAGAGGPAFDMQGFMNAFNQSQQAIAAANAAAANRQSLAFMEWRAQMDAQMAQREADARAQVEEYNRRVAEQRRQQYDRELTLTADQIATINEQKALTEQGLRDAASQFEAGRGELTSRTQSNISQIVRDFAAQQAAGLTGLGARNRGIDPSAAGRFAAEVASGRAGALAQTQTSAYDQLRQLKEALDERQRSGSARIAELNRLATQLGTNLTNLFPGVNF